MAAQPASYSLSIFPRFYSTASLNTERLARAVYKYKGTTSSTPTELLQPR